MSVTLSSHGLTSPNALRERRELAGLSQSELAEALEVSASLVKLWETGRRAPGRRIAELERALASQAPVEAPEMPGSELRELREDREISQSALAELLGVKQQAIAGWEAAEVPEGRREVLKAVLTAEVPVMAALLRELRQRAGLKQAELAELVGARQAEVSEWERGAKPVPAERWQRIREELEAAARGPLPEHSQQPMTAEELREGVKRLNWSLRDFANAAGIPRGTVGPWATGAKRIPPERWAKFRALLGTAEPAPASRDRVAEALPLVLDAVEAEPGLGRQELVRRVDAPEPNARAALARALEQDRIHERRVPRERADGVVRFLPGLFPGPRPAELPRSDRASLLVPEVLPAVEAGPGRTRRQVAESLPHDRRLAERAIARALREGLVHERAVARRARGGPHIHLGLFPGSAPAPASPIPGNVLRRLRERLIVSVAELALRLDVSTAQLRTWERSEVEPAWRDAVAAALRPVADEAKAREADRRRRLVEAIAAEAGLPRWGELARHLQPVERPHLRRLLDELVAAGELHERPADNGHGAGLFAGPPPPGWEPGPAISADELHAMREWAGLTQKELARRIGASVASVNAWEQGTKPVPTYRRPQLRQVLAERKPPEPAPLAAETLRAERKRIGWAQAKLARVVSASQPTLGSWERGDREVPAHARDELRALFATTPSKVTRSELRQWKTTHGLTTRDLAELLSVTAAATEKWLQHGVPSRHTEAVRAALARHQAPAQSSLFDA